MQRVLTSSYGGRCPIGAENTADAAVSRSCSPGRAQSSIWPTELEVVGPWRSSVHSPHFGGAEAPEVAQRKEFGVTGLGNKR